MRCLAALVFAALVALTASERSRDTSADLMARNILEWIQGIYRQGTRKTRQESNGYLPPSYGGNQRPPEKPRPFQPASTAGYPSPSPGLNEVSGYPDYQQGSSSFGSGFSPNRPSSTFGTTPRPTYIPQSPSSRQPSPSGFGSPSTGFSTNSPKPFGGSSAAAGFPGVSTTYLPPSATYGYPSTNSPPSGYPSSGGSGYPSSPTPTPGFPTPSGGYPSPSGGSSPTGGSGPTDSYGYPSPSPFPSFPTPGGGNTGGGSPPTGTGGYPSPGGTPTGTGGYPSPGGTPTGPGVTPGGGSSPGGSPGVSPGGGTSPGSSPGVSPGGGVTSPGSTPGVSPGGGDGTGAGSGSDTAVTGPDDDANHPPHIHELQVECSKTMMTINIEFNRQFDGVIYSKGFYMMPECRYVAENSGQTKYSFTVNLDSCGTEFINDFEGEAGQAYLENVLVLQNELGIQEVWDTVRRVRCLWEGNINKALTVSLSVDMLNQEIVTFSGDTATAKLDVQVGKGPFAPAATGLVKIGEPMTLVVSVEGDPGFDLQVRDCVARDESSTNVVQLTDERGCILKPKLFGAFQKTKETGNTGASIIAYAFFQAFKFPDVMDLFIECNVELCKTDCEACPEANQQIDPGRRRRDISYAPTNSSSGSLSDPIRMSRGFRVIMPDDLSFASSEALENLENNAIAEITVEKSVCMSYGGFYMSLSLLLAMLVTTTMSAAILYVKIQRIARGKAYDLPKGS